MSPKCWQKKNQNYKSWQRFDPHNTTSANCGGTRLGFSFNFSIFHFLQKIRLTIIYAPW